MVRYSNDCGSEMQTKNQTNNKLFTMETTVIDNNILFYLEPW